MLGWWVLSGEISTSAAAALMLASGISLLSQLCSPGGTPAWASSALAKHSATAAAEELLCSIPDVCVLHWWKDPHLLCSPLGLINGVIYRLAD